LFPQGTPAFAAGRLFPQGTPASSTSKTDRHDINEMLLKVALKTITPVVSTIDKKNIIFTIDTSN
jgi:hypothetical protein